MTKILKWQQELIEYYATMSNEDLLNEVIEQSSGLDDIEGLFTSRDAWGYKYAKRLLWERVKDWLEIKV